MENVSVKTIETESISGSEIQSQPDYITISYFVFIGITNIVFVIALFCSFIDIIAKNYYANQFTIISWKLFGMSMLGTISYIAIASRLRK